MDLRHQLIEQLQAILSPLVEQFDNIGIFGEQASCYGSSISWFEMYCRSSYGIIAYTKATGDTEYLNKFYEILPNVIESELYQSFQDYDQKAVELVPVAATLLIFKEDTWNRYSEYQREKILSYLKKINTIQLCRNNWVFFRILVNSIIQVLDNNIEYKKRIDEDWEFIDRCYSGNGWYRDGIVGIKDYYVAFAFHFYSLLYLYLFPQSDRKQIIEERATIFAKDYLLFFDEKGREIPFGRSLIYRYATLAFWSMLIVDDICINIWPNIKRIIEKNLNWWSEQDIVSTDGCLNIGFSYPNSLIRESYNSSGSVYWSLKFFLLLLKDKSSHFWSIQQIYEKYDSLIKSVANGDIIISKNKLINIGFINSFQGSGQLQDFAKYMHFAYNSETAFNLSPTTEVGDSISDDSSLILFIREKKYVREKNLYYHVNNNIQTFIWKASNDCIITTIVVPHNSGYYRIHKIDTKCDCYCLETGFPIEARSISEEKQKHYICLQNPTLKSSIKCLYGKGSLTAFPNTPSTNIYHKRTIMPVCEYKIHQGTSIIADFTGLEPIGSQNYQNGLIRIFLSKANILQISMVEQNVKIDLGTYSVLNLRKHLILYKVWQNECISNLKSSIKKLLIQR